MANFNRAVLLLFLAPAIALLFQACFEDTPDANEPHSKGAHCRLAAAHTADRCAACSFIKKVKSGNVLKQDWRIDRLATLE